MEKDCKRFSLWGMLCLFMALTFTACSGDDNEELQNYFTPDANSEMLFEQGLDFEDGASARTVTFDCGEEWKAVVSNASWCTVNPAQGKAGKNTVSISAEANETEQSRSALITFLTGSISRQLKVNQAPKGGEVVNYPEGLSYSPEAPDADAALTLYYKADKSSALYNTTDDLYVHIGVGTENGWEHVITTWGQNDAKFKMTKEADNVWSLAITPSIRVWFSSGELAINQLALVIRNAGADKQTADLFVPVTDSKYQAFQPAAIKNATMPSGLVEGINISGSSVTFVLYDKDTNGNHKDYAHIVGDFNNWTLSNDEKSQMYRDETAGCWWITVDNLDVTKEYAFQYYVGTTGGTSIRLADAYTEKILDPDNDKYITSTYTDDMTYPEGAKGVASTFKIQQDAYNWSVSDFKIAEPSKLVVYELHLRDFTEKGNIQGAMEKLSYLKALGVNAIELMPVQEFDGNDSWGYNPCYFFALDKAYGTKKDYKDFIDACHKEGIAVILDVVYNHATGASPFAKLYWDSSANQTAKNNPYFNVTAPHPYSVYHDFNHESDLVRKFVKRNLKFLLEEYKIDGFRFDLTKGFTQKSSTESTASNYDESRIAILTDYNTAIKEANPNAFVVLEHLCDYSEEKVLAENGMHMWRNVNWNYCQSAMGYSDRSNFNDMYEQVPAWVGYMESHDEERMGYKQTAYSEGDLKTDVKTRMSQLATNAAFFLTVPGPKMIWQFGELGYDFSISSNQSGVVDGNDNRTGRKPIRWDYYDDANRKALHDVYANLMKLRNDNPELFDCTGSFTWKVGVSDWANGRSLYAESTTGKKLVVLGNFTNAATSVTFPASTGIWKEWTSGEEKTVEANVEVPAHGYIVYTNF